MYIQLPTRPCSHHPGESRALTDPHCRCEGAAQLPLLAKMGTDLHRFVASKCKYKLSSPLGPDDTREGKGKWSADPMSHNLLYLVDAT